MSSLTLPLELSLIGKSAIVTGASRGIGTGIALELAKRGANVALVYRADSSTLLVQHLADEITRLGSKATTIQIDLNELHCGHTVVSAAQGGLSVDKIDILVNNAGADTPPATSQEFDPSLFEKIMNVNVRAPLLLLQSILPHMSPHGGRVINISSTLARLPADNLAVYASSKAALECLTRHWALELGRSHGMTVNAIAIGIVETHSAAVLSAEKREALLQLPSAARRLGSVDDVAQIVAFLASDAARWINGHTLAGNGGSIFF